MAWKMAKVLRRGKDQFVILPGEYQFEGDEVCIRRDLKIGDVILSKKPIDWDSFFLVREKANEGRSDFMSDRVQGKIVDKDLF